MEKVSINVSVDADIKDKAQELFEELGTDLSTAVNIFLRQSVRESAFPFSVERSLPNADTLAAMKESEEIMNHPEKYKRYSSFSEALKEIKSEMDEE